jgi:hypothetical protein
MNCFCSFNFWDRGFESHSRHGCLCMRLFCVCVVLYLGSLFARTDHPSNEPHRLCKEKDYEIEEEARAQQIALQPFMND